MIRGTPPVALAQKEPVSPQVEELEELSSAEHASNEPIKDLSQVQQPLPDPELLKEIQIVRLSPGTVRNIEGQLRFQVSAFSPILAVKVNGFAQMVSPGADFMKYDVPYQLLPGKNRFLVFVQTRVAEHEKAIILTYDPQPLESPWETLPLDLIVIFGETQSDNILRVPDTSTTKRSGALNQLLVSLGYHRDFFKTSTGYIKGLLKMDRQKDRSLVSEETLFRQLSLEYKVRELWGFEFNSALGHNVISNKSGTASLTREGEFITSSESLYLFGAAEKNLGKSVSLKFKMQLEQQDLVDSNDEDGTLNQLDLGGKLQLWGVRLKTVLQSISTTFMDTSMNYQTSIFSLGINYPLSSWIFGFKFRTSDQKYLLPDSSSGITYHHQQDQVSLPLKYLLSKNEIVDLSINQIKKASNDASKAYNESQAVIQLILSY